VKAKDINGAESDWALLEVTMPKNKPYLVRLLPNIIEKYSVLKQLFNRLLQL